MSNVEVPKVKHEEFIKKHHEKLVSTPKEYDGDNVLREQQCKEIWEFSIIHLLSRKVVTKRKIKRRLTPVS